MLEKCPAKLGSSENGAKAIRAQSVQQWQGNVYRSQFKIKTVSEVQK